MANVLHRYFKTNLFTIVILVFISAITLSFFVAKINAGDDTCCDECGDCESTPKVTPGTTPGITPIVTPEVTPGTTPGITPIVTPKITPSVTPVITPGVTPVSTPEITPSIVPTPVSTTTPENPPSNPNPPAYVCNDPKPGTPSNLTASWTSSTQVKLSWTHAPDPHSNYLVSYGPTSGNYLYGSPNVGNDNYYTVGSLQTNHSYCFVVQAQNGCTGGERSKEVCLNQRVTTTNVLGATDNYNPLVTGIKASYGGSVLGTTTELLGTAEVSYSKDKLPSGNTPDENHSISIPSLNLSTNIYHPQKIGDEYTVGQHEVLFDFINGNRVYYGHNGTDVFGKLYQIKKGAHVTANGIHYSVDQVLFVHKSQVEILNSNANQIVLTTCSFTMPDYRIVVKASQN